MQERDVFLIEIRDLDSMPCHCHVQFSVGDLIWLCLNQRAMITVPDGAAFKLVRKFFGVTARIRPVSYRLRLGAKEQRSMMCSMWCS
jgi:hypothetical protein